MSDMPIPMPLAPEVLVWCCDPASLPFETTEEVDPGVGNSWPIRAPWKRLSSDYNVTPRAKMCMCAGLPALDV